MAGKARPKPRIVYPVPGFYLATVPAVPHPCGDPFCVESGAFAPDPPPGAADVQQPEAPADAGVSDSQEA